MSVGESALWNVSYTDRLISLALLGFSSAAILNGFNSSDDYMTVEELRHHYQVPGNCESAIKGEGQVVFVKGYIDWPNVFSKKIIRNCLMKNSGFGIMQGTMLLRSG